MILRFSDEQSQNNSELTRVIKTNPNFNMESKQKKFKMSSSTEREILVAMINLKPTGMLIYLLNL